MRLSILCAIATMVPASSACTGVMSPGDDDGFGLCPAGSDTAPATPQMIAPAPGGQDVLPDEVVLQSSAFSDPDPGDGQSASEFELWLMSGGEAVARVWSATIEDPSKLHEVTLADGVFDVGDQLQPWVKYGARARYREDSQCGAWSEWSEILPFRTDDGSTPWFDPAVVHDVYLYLSPASQSAIDAEATPPGCVPFLRSYHAGDVAVDGVRYTDAGVRAKGGCGSARHLSGKTSFKVSLAWDDPAIDGCPAEARIHGLKRLTLNNMVQDSSFVHEMLTYRFYQLMGVPAPRASYARVHVNDALWGLYLNLETIDRRFLSRWFDDNDGMLYEGTYYCDLVAANVPSGEENDTAHCISKKFHPGCGDEAGGHTDGDPEDFSAIRTLIDQLAALPDGGFYPAVEQYIDLDTFLSMWAVDTIVENWDGYALYTTNNYRVYHDPTTDRWTFIQTGVDQTWVSNSMANDIKGAVAKRCWADAGCKQAFLARVSDALTVLEQSDLGGMATTLRDTIDQDVQDDPRKEGSYNGFRSAVDAAISFIDQRPAEVRDALGL